MNLKKRLIILTLSIFTWLSAFCQGVINLEVLDLKEENDTLVVNYHIRIGPNTIETGQSLQVSPVMQAGDSASILPGITVLGRNKQKVFSRFNKKDIKNFIPAGIKNDTAITYNIKIPYALWMDSASLVLMQEISSYRGKSTLTIYKLRDKIEPACHEPYSVNPIVSFMTPQQQEYSKHSDKVHLYFQSGHSVIQSAYRSNSEKLIKIDDTIRDIMNNPNAILQGLYITGYASPDGSYPYNERLSKKRADALKEYIRNKFNLDEDIFHLSSVAEDWDGLVRLVNAADIAQKDTILKIISIDEARNESRVALKRLNKGASYYEILKDILAELRRVECGIDYMFTGNDEKLTFVVPDKNSGNYSQLELYNVALSYGKDSEQFDKLVIETIPHYFPQDATANNNAAAALIARAQITMAKPYLAKAGITPSTLNNMGIVYLLEGDMDTAEKYFKQARDQGNEESVANLKEISLKRENNKKMKRYKNRNR